MGPELRGHPSQCCFYKTVPILQFRTGQLRSDPCSKTQGFRPAVAGDEMLAMFTGGSNLLLLSGAVGREREE